MYRQKWLHKEIQEELARCVDLHRKISVETKFLPKGTLTIDHADNLYRYVREGSKQYKVMLKTSDKALMVKLKRRRYAKECLKKLSQRIDVCRAFIDKDILYDPKTIEKQLPRQYRGLKDVKIFLEGDINEEEWITAPYKTNPFPIRKPHYTPRNLCTRSKSEVMIATRLEERGEAFRYDAEVALRRRNVYPDFTILDRKRRRVVYWEHLGKVGDEGYMFDNLRKFEEYAECGIVLGNNLFITYESENRPLSIADIDRKLDMILN